MAYHYNHKVVVSGRHVEVYKYKKAVWRGFDRTQESPPSIPTTYEKPSFTSTEQIKLQQQKTQFSVNRTRTEIRRLINSNQQLNKFLTLTFAENITDLKPANYAFNQFVKRLAYKYPGFEYLAVPEFQKRGAVHYHVVCNLPFVEPDAIAHVWGQGFIKINKLDKVTNIGAYVCKYLSKDMFDERTFGKKKFFRSQTLKEPAELTGRLAVLFEKQFLAALLPSFEKTFLSDWTGEVEYKAYALADSPPLDGVIPRTLLRHTV